MRWLTVVLLTVVLVVGCAPANRASPGSEDAGSAGREGVEPGHVSSRYGNDDGWVCSGDSPQCGASRTRTVIRPDGSIGPLPRPEPPADCFVVPFQMDPAEAALPTARALSPLCRVFTPVVRDRSDAIERTAVLTDDAFDPFIAFADVLDAFHEFFLRLSDGRPVILVSSSTHANALATTVLRDLVAHPDGRGRLVAAVVPGGVSQPDVQPDVCGALTEVGCVIPHAVVSPGNLEPSGGRPLGIPDGWAGACVDPADLYGRPGLLPQWMVVTSHAHQPNCDVLAVIHAKLAGRTTIVRG